MITRELSEQEGKNIGSAYSVDLIEHINNLYIDDY